MYTYLKKDRSAYSYINTSFCSYYTLTQRHEFIREETMSNWISVIIKNESTSLFTGHYAHICVCTLFISLVLKEYNITTIK